MTHPIPPFKPPQENEAASKKKENTPKPGFPAWSGLLESDLRREKMFLNQSPMSQSLPSENGGVALSRPTQHVAVAQNSRARVTRFESFVPFTRVPFW